jgi:16S rRNA (guanine966-N2)-methyltransferase
VSQRILSGKWRGQILAGQTGAKTRPTTSLMRQAIFNIWSDHMEGARFLDLFSGTGAMGFEALSAGASQVTLVENDRQALLCIRKSQEKLVSQIEDRLVVRAQEVERFLAFSHPDTFDLIYADPPYDWSADKKNLPGHYVVWLLTQLQGHVAFGSRIMIEQERHVKEKIPQRVGIFSHLESRQYGDSMIHHFEASREQSTAPEQDLLSH